MTERTAAQVKERHIEIMGPELGSIYNALWNEVAWLFTNWQEYVELFGTKPSRIELLNRAASGFFSMLQDRLWDDTLLHIARLTDLPRTGRKENLTVCRLPEHITAEEPKKAVQAKIDVVLPKIEFARDWRNRRIAHSDLELKVAIGAEPLEPASRAMVWEAVRGIADVLNAVSYHYENSTTAFEGVGRTGGAVELLHVLDDGLRFAEERSARRRTGEYRADDINRDI